MKPGLTLLLFVAVAVGLVALGIAMLRHARVNPARPGDAPMAEYYLSMACRCPWPGADPSWSIHLPGPRVPTGLRKRS